MDNNNKLHYFFFILTPVRSRHWSRDMLALVQEMKRPKGSDIDVLLSKPDVSKIPEKIGI